LCCLSYLYRPATEVSWLFLMDLKELGTQID
jgi:hypothetical protein